MTHSHTVESIPPSYLLVLLRSEERALPKGLPPRTSFAMSFVDTETLHSFTARQNDTAIFACDCDVPSIPMYLVMLDFLTATVFCR